MHRCIIVLFIRSNKPHHSILKNNNNNKNEKAAIIIHSKLTFDLLNVVDRVAMPTLVIADAAHGHKMTDDTRA